ncbi:TetR/AcrR family transcriptional regulator [Amycolatopsis anabasis]|uniref:TetR/AcrR family transcriptional regulator n=1 Tax=Amycolatopsis anabasis TaxID=1840409 RepID=UPI00131DF65A|nr:TetR/AcrR family transcriptional regulator [Amycolatopsis anabasis]
MADQGTGERIASAALAILVEEGAQAVTMRRVAAAAGVTPMATYRHFPNRETLLRSVAEAGLAELAQDWGKHVEAADMNTRLESLLTDFLDFALGKPNLYTFLLTDRREAARRFPEDFRSGGSAAFNPVYEAVQDWMREGLLRPDDPLEVTLALTSPAQGLVQQYLAGRMALSEADFRALCRRTVERVLNGVKAP